MTRPTRSSNPIAGALETVTRQFKRARRWANDHAIRSRVSAACGTDVREIKTYTRPDELAALYRLALAVPQGTHALEIGSHLGASSCYIATPLAQRRGSTLTCVDTWNNQTMPEGLQDTMPAFQAHTHGLSPVIRTVRKWSGELTEADVQFPLSFVFIDGDHSYQGCRTDFEKVRNWVSPGGVVAFHDAVYDEFPGVSQVIGEALAGGEWGIGGQCLSLFWIFRRQGDRK